MVLNSVKKEERRRVLERQESEPPQHPIMSISENSTLLTNNRENEGSYQLLDDRYNSGPGVNAYDKS